MVQNKCDRLEMQIVDDILGNLTEEAHRTLHHHLATCHDCRRRYDEWRRHLQDASNTTPSPRVYHRLRRRVRWQYVRRTWFRPAAVMASVASGATVALLFAVVSLFQTQMPTVSSSSVTESPVLGTPRPHAIVRDARTVSFPISSQQARSMGVYGHVWINGHTDEMFFRVHGLITDRNHDYQVWLVKAVQRENAGLLQMTGEFAELYTRGQNIREVQFISISKEPKGGSVKPTTPEMILFDFVPVHNVAGPRPE